MSTHDLDRIALLGGLVFVVLGVVGLLQGVGWIDSGAPWAVIGVIAVLGLTGIALSLPGLRPTPGTGDDPHDPHDPHQQPLDDLS